MTYLPGIEQSVDGFFASAIDAIITIDGSSRIVQFNPAAEKLFRCPAEDALGSPIERFIPHPFQRSNGEYLRPSQPSGMATQSMGKFGSLRGLRADREGFPIDATMTQIESEASKLFAIVIRNPAERAPADEDLRPSEESYREVVLRSPLAMAVTRLPEQKCDVLNDRFTDLFGYTIDDVPDVAHWWPLAYPDETYREKIKAEWQKRVQRALELNCAMEPMEAIVHCKDGSTRYIEFHFAAVADAFLVSFVDLTERRRAEVARSETEERFRVIADAAPVMIWMTGPDKGCTYVSKPWLDFTG